jgi:hypothetical protein
MSIVTGGLPCLTDEEVRAGQREIPSSFRLMATEYALKKFDDSFGSQNEYVKSEQTRFAQ